MKRGLIVFSLVVTISAAGIFLVRGFQQEARAEAYRRSRAAIGFTRPTPVPTAAPIPPELARVRKALANSPNVHITHYRPPAAPSYPESKKELWRVGNRYRLDDPDNGSHFYGDRTRYDDGEREWLVSSKTQQVLVARSADNRRFLNLTYETLNSEGLTSPTTIWTQKADWQATKNELHLRLLDSTDYLVKFDPTTGRPREENMVIRGQKHHITYDYAPIPASIIAPKVPAGFRLFDVDAIRAREAAALRKPINVLTVGKEKLYIHRVEVNNWGDITLIYEGKLPTELMAVKTPSGKRVPMYGYLEVRDSLGSSSGPPPPLARIYGRPSDGAAPLPFTPDSKALYEIPVRGSRIELLKAEFPAPPPTGGDVLSALTIRCHSTAPDKRPRRITLRFILLPHNDGAEPEVQEYTTDLLTPSNDSSSDVFLAGTSPNESIHRKVTAWERQAAAGNPPPPAVLDCLLAEFVSENSYTYIDIKSLEAIWKLNKAAGRDKQAREVALFAKKSIPVQSGQESWVEVALK